ncbi:MAG: hypothetical protein ACREXP_31200 [Steroidobacteraceae bacterium]
MATGYQTLEVFDARRKATRVKTSDRAPDFELSDDSDTKRRFTKLLEQGRVVLFF